MLEGLDPGFCHNTTAAYDLYNFFLKMFFESIFLLYFEFGSYIDSFTTKSQEIGMQLVCNNLQLI